MVEFISSYSFNLYYIKGKDMVLSDFLLRQSNDDSYPHEIIPLFFNMHQVLQENCYKIDSYLVLTRSQAKSSGVKPPEVSVRLEKQHANSIKGSVVKP